MTTLAIKNDAATEVAQLLIDQVGTDEVATSKLTIGAAGVNDGFVSAANPLPVTGTITAVTSVTNVVHVDDNSSSLTVDNATLSVVGGGVEATALRVTLASDSTGVLSVDDNGSTLSVDDGAGSLTVDNGGTFAVQESGAALTALQLIDDAVYTDAIGTPSKGLAVMGTDGTNPQLVSVNATGHVNIADGGNSITVDGTVAVSGTVTVDGSGSTQPVSDAGGSLTIDNAALAVTGGGVEASALRVTIASDSTGVVSVDDNAGSLTIDAPVGTPAFVRLSDGAAAISTLPVSLASVPSHAVTNAGTFAVQAASAGDVAHDSADSGNPVKVGAKATASVAGETLVAAADRTNLLAGTDGVLLVRNGYSLEDVVQERTTNTDGASTAFASGLAAPGAGVRLWITNVDISNSSASFCTVDLRDGAAGSVLWTLPVPATGGVVKKFDPPLKLTANTALAFDASGATTTLTLSANGFKSKV